MCLDYRWLDFVDVHVSGSARDEVTDADGTTKVFEESSLRLTTSSGAVADAEIDPPAFDATALLGLSLRSGFRRALRTTFEPDGGPLGLLLDDAPGGLIAAGYVYAMAGTTDPEVAAARRGERGQRRCGHGAPGRPVRRVAIRRDDDGVGAGR